MGCQCQPAHDVGTRPGRVAEVLALRLKEVVVSDTRDRHTYRRQTRREYPSAALRRRGSIQLRCHCSLECRSDYCSWSRWRIKYTELYSQVCEVAANRSHARNMVIRPADLCRARPGEELAYLRQDHRLGLRQSASLQGYPSRARFDLLFWLAG